MSLGSFGIQKLAAIGDIDPEAWRALLVPSVVGGTAAGALGGAVGAKMKKRIPGKTITLPGGTKVRTPSKRALSPGRVGKGALAGATLGAIGVPLARLAGQLTLNAADRKALLGM